MACLDRSINILKIEMKIVSEKSQYHRFALYYDYTPERVEFCKQLKDSFGWQKFSFNQYGELKRWVFSDSLFIPVIKERFPEAIVEPVVESVVFQEQSWAMEKQKKQWMSS